MGEDNNDERSTNLNDIISNVTVKIGGKTYTDEPIIIRASQMKNYTPPEITQMRKIARDNYFKMSDAHIFVLQAKSMESFIDDCLPDDDFTCYFPTYQSMSDRQLRGYFAWRAKVRRGEVCRTSLSYAYVYIYELLNMIGAESPIDAFQKLKSFSQSYGELDCRIIPYAELWKRDFIIFHNLDSALIEKTRDLEFEEAVLILKNYREHTPEQLLDTLDVVSPYSLKNSRFGKAYPNQAAQIMYGVFDAICEYYQKNRGRSLCESLFGTVCNSGYNMFKAAVFYEESPHPDCFYGINELDSFSCKNGAWYNSRIIKNTGKNKRLGVMIKSLDFILREKFKMKSQLKCPNITKFIRKLAEEEIDKYEAENKKKSLPIINIDVSQLKKIRAVSEKTADLLIIDDEAELDIPETAKPVSDSESPLEEAEILFVKCLLEGKPYAQAVKNSGRLLSLLCEDINEKLFELFGDNVIEFDGETPCIIEDYADELKGTLKL